MSKIMQKLILPNEERGIFLPEPPDVNYDSQVTQETLREDPGYLEWLSGLEKSMRERRK